MTRRVNPLSHELYHHAPEDGGLPFTTYYALSEAVNALEAMRAIATLLFNSAMQRNDHLDGLPLHPNQESSLLLGLVALAGYVRNDCDWQLETQSMRAAKAP